MQHGLLPIVQLGQRLLHAPRQIHRGEPSRNAFSPASAQPFHHRRGVPKPPTPPQTIQPPQVLVPLPEPPGFDRHNELVDRCDPQMLQLVRQHVLIDENQRAIGPHNLITSIGLGPLLRCHHNKHQNHKSVPTPTFDSTRLDCPARHAPTSRRRNRAPWGGDTRTVGFKCSSKHVHLDPRYRDHTHQDTNGGFGERRPHATTPGHDVLTNSQPRGGFHSQRAATA